MSKHVNILAMLYFIFGAMGCIALVLILVVTILGSGLASMEDPEAGVILGIIGTIGVIIAGIASIPNLLAGLGLKNRKEWGRILTIILSILNLFAVPFGTALGVYGLIVLFDAEVVKQFKFLNNPINE